VDGGGSLADGDDRPAAPGFDDVRGRRRHAIALDLDAAEGIGEIDVEKAIAGEVRIESEAEQAALTLGRDRQGEDRRGRDHSAGKIEDLDRAGFLHDEQAARVAWGSGGEKRLAEARRDAGRDDAACLALRPVRVVAVDKVRPRAAVQRVAAIVADDEIDGHGCLIPDG
jgi:hypothetical protein